MRAWKRITKVAQVRATHLVTICLKSFNLTTMKKFISAALVVAMTAASCANKEDLGNNNSGAPVQPEGDGSVTFVADFAEPIAKATPSYDAEAHAVSVLWELNDKVGVYAGEQGPAEFTAQTEGATTTLNGMVAPANTYYAMYPYDVNASIADGQISTVLPAAQTATADAFMAHLAVASTTGSKLNFKNVCGLVRVYVGCEHVTKIEFKGNADEVVAGEIIVDAADATYVSGAATEKVITVTPPAEAATFPVGAYYFSVLPQNFTKGFTVTYYTANGNIDTRSTDAVNVQRSNLVVGRPLTAIAGEGSVAKPFIIANVHDLCCLSEVLSTKNANYVELSADIDMAGVTTWTPINNDRTAANVREIHFDGKNKKISNFAPTTFVNGPDGKTNYSLFGVLYGSCKNLTFIDANINQTSSSTTAVLAAFGGYTGNNSTLIENVHVSGTVTAKKVVAGLVGQAQNLKMSRCSADVEIISTDDDCAILVGRAEGGEVEIQNSYAEGSVTCTASNNSGFGGLVAHSNTGVTKLTINKCFSTASVVGDFQVGGLVGVVNGAATYVNIVDSYSTGDLSSGTAPVCGKQFGGILGISKGITTIERCWYSGQIEVAVGTGTTSNNKKNPAVGGIFGMNTSEVSKQSYVKNCFSLAEINADKNYIGGVVGTNQTGLLTVSECYAGTEINCSLSGAQVGGIVGAVASSSDASKTMTTVNSCKFGGLLPSSASATHNFIYGGPNSLAESVYFTEENNSQLAENEVANYATASKIATQLRWSTETWNLTGETPTLKCFE